MRAFGFLIGVLFISSFVRTEAFALQAGPSDAFYISTPISHPYGYHWVTYAFIMCLFIINILLYRMLNRQKGIIRSIVVSAYLVVLFAVTFFSFGVTARTRYFICPASPGLGLPSQLLLYKDWNDAGGLFITWNIYGLLFLSICLIACHGLYNNGIFRKMGILIIILNAAMYLLFLIPYIVGGAIAAGGG